MKRPGSYKEEPVGNFPVADRDVRFLDKYQKQLERALMHPQLLSPVVIIWDNDADVSWQLAAACSLLPLDMPQLQHPSLESLALFLSASKICRRHHAPHIAGLGQR